MHTSLRVAWQVTSLQCPVIRRHCSRCRSHTPFACSMKFRTNAQKKRLDVWLIFRCRACDETWNLPVFERIAIGDLAPDMFQAIAHNDPALALRHAFDHVHLARYGVVEDSRGVTVRKSRLHACDGDAAAVEIEISLARPCGVRLDRLLSCELGITRARVRALQLAGFLCVLPAGRKPLASPIADGQRIAIALTGDAALAAIIRRRALA